MREADLEALSLVRQVGQPVGALLLVHLDPGALPLLFHEGIEPRPHGLHLRVAQDPGQRQVALLIEAALLLVGQ